MGNGAGLDVFGEFNAQRLVAAREARFESRSVGEIRTDILANPRVQSSDFGTRFDFAALNKGCAFVGDDSFRKDDLS